MPITFRTLEPEALEPFAHLTFPAHAKAFAEAIPAQAQIAPRRFALYVDGAPAGLALFRHAQETGESELMSLVVDKPMRRQGLGAALLAQAEAVLRCEGSERLVTRFSDRLPGVPAFSALLARRGWTAPEPERIRILGPVGKTLNVFRDRDALVARARRDGLKLIPWQDYADDARSIIEDHIETGRAPEWTRIGADSPDLDREFSVILANAENEVVGWVICQFHEHVRRWSFPVGWIGESDQRRGWLLVAYADGARRLGERYGSDAVAVFESTNAMPMMWKVLEHRFEPHATLADRILKAGKALKTTT